MKCGENPRVSGKKYCQSCLSERSGEKKSKASIEHDIGIGKDIKTYATIVATIVVILSVIIGIANILLGVGMNSNAHSGSPGDVFMWSGIAVLIVGSLSAYIWYLFIYGFGILVHRTAEIAKEAKKK
jgi:hypothetical protein